MTYLLSNLFVGGGATLAAVAFFLPRGKKQALEEVSEEAPRTPAIAFATGFAVGQASSGRQVASTPTVGEEAPGIPLSQAPSNPQDDSFWGVPPSGVAAQAGGEAGELTSLTPSLREEAPRPASGASPSTEYDPYAASEDHSDEVLPVRAHETRLAEAVDTDERYGQSILESGDVVEEEDPYAPPLTAEDLPEATLSDALLSRFEDDDEPTYFGPRPLTTQERATARERWERSQMQEQSATQVSHAEVPSAPAAWWQPEQAEHEPAADGVAPAVASAGVRTGWWEATDQVPSPTHSEPSPSGEARDDLGREDALRTGDLDDVWGAISALCLSGELVAIEAALGRWPILTARIALEALGDVPRAHYDEYLRAKDPKFGREALDILAPVIGYL